MKTILALLLSLLILSPFVFAEEPQSSTATPSPVTFGAFIDSYYAYDLNTPLNFDRQFTTQAARHNEFNINLAYVEAKLDKDRVHGRLSLQGGTSVLANYASEPVVGTISGLNLLARNLQEAYAGYRITENTWIDAGIYFSHIGSEGFISRDNLTYTRSFVADNSPYYQNGVRLSSKLSEKFSAQLHVVNGWQIISENNDSKALGTNLEYRASPTLTLSYNTFFGKEYAFRHFHDFYAKWNPNETWSVVAQADIGFQIDSLAGGPGTWGGFQLTTQYALNKIWSLVFRGERYTDPKQIIQPLSNGAAFQLWSSSIGVNAALESNFWWRNEIRGYLGDSPIFSSPSGFKSTDLVIVSSISASI